MKKVISYILMGIAVFGVAGLGYYAYTLATDTLVFSFVGQEHQSGDRLVFAVSGPSIVGSLQSDMLIDSGALEESLVFNQKPFHLQAGQGYINVSGGYAEISPGAMQKGDELKINAATYNRVKSTSYKLGRDLILTNTTLPRALNVSMVGLPRDANFAVSLYGYPHLGIGDVRWYAGHTGSGGMCAISSVWGNGDRLARVIPTMSDHHTEGQTDQAFVHLDIDTTLSDLCVIAGLAGDFVTVDSQRLDPFVATGSIVDVLSPELAMDSTVEFDFSDDIFADTGAVYSDAYIDNRTLQKAEFLKKLSITPDMGLTEEDISLNPRHAILRGKFLPGKKYTINLDDIMDIYGRSQSLKIDFTPVQEPYLGINLATKKTIWKANEPVIANLYALDTPKSAYTLKLCHISLEGYARAERIIDEAKKSYTDAVYSLLSSDLVSGCAKKDVFVSASGAVSSFRVADMLPTGKLDPGLYILAFRNPEDTAPFSRFVSPRVFSVIDTEVTMKVDASGKMAFLTTDITTGKPIVNQEIKLLRNVGRETNSTWNSATQTYTTEYLPLSTQIFSGSMSLGKSGTDGYATSAGDIVFADGSGPYFDMDEYGSSDGTYASFIATSQGDGHFGYVVSTWNDGITGYNFGLKDSDYSWSTRGQYSAYVHTDRLLYLPGDTVYFHGIIRENTKTLTLPKQKFHLTITDPNGKNIVESDLDSNEFGSVATQFVLGSGATLGSYSVSLTSAQDGQYIENGYTSFQVEVFKNPTFTAKVQLHSPDLDGNTIKNLRKTVNTDPMYPWYASVYTTDFTLDGTVSASYYNGAMMANTPFSYRIYRSPHYADNYWEGCFWGCYAESSPEFYTEGSGMIDSDGVGVFHVPIGFSSFNDDYTYTAEVTIHDPMTAETVVTPGTLLVEMPATYKTYDVNNTLTPDLDHRVLNPGEPIAATIVPKYGNWNTGLADHYIYQLIRREYSHRVLDDLRIAQVVLPSSNDTIVASGSITTNILTIPTTNMSGGEYHLRIFPKTSDASIVLPDSAISDTVIYISGNATSRDAALRVIPEKTVYHLGETARVLISMPFTGGYLYLTRERGGVIEHEYIPFTGSTITREYVVDDTFVPNVYIGAIAFASTVPAGTHGYAVGYGEIVTDLADKVATLSLTPDKTVYKNRETATVDLDLADSHDRPLVGEVEVMVVDESLIRLLGNIDLNVLSKMYQKYPFTMRTALTFIGMERNLFLSRKGSNGGSGDKGGNGAEISARSLFKNTAYYNASIITDADGHARFSFVLPDNVTDYRIIAIAQTKASEFGVAQKTISVRRDYTLEPHAPMIAYHGDTINISFNAFNATSSITQALATLTIGTGTSMTGTSALILDPVSSKAGQFPVQIPQNWNGTIPYTLTLTSGKNTLDSIQGTITISAPPIIEATSRQFGSFTGQISLMTSTSANIDRALSTVELHVSPTLLLSSDEVVRSLVTYPYGCIEQTVASTLPDALALRFHSLMGTEIDAHTAQANLNTGIEKILSMQIDGGWKYWESDTSPSMHVTPYVLRSLERFRTLGASIPEQSILAGLQYLKQNMDPTKNTQLAGDPDLQAEVFMTYGLYHETDAATGMLSTLDLSKLSRHGYIDYAYGMWYLGKYTEAIDATLRSMMQDTTTRSTYWYWDDRSDRALYAELLIDRGQYSEARTVLDALLRQVDITSYYTSTQTKIQILYDLLKYTDAMKISPSTGTLHTDMLIADFSLSLKDPRFSLTKSVQALGAPITMTTDSASPLIYELIERDRPKDIFSTPEESHGMIVNRKIELVDESKGVDRDGNFLSVSSISGTTFDRTKLYRVTLTVSIYDHRPHQPWYYLTLEDFMPGAWRPIRGVFQTESVTTTDSPGAYSWNGWTHVEAQTDRILATNEYGDSDSATYTYYFRPEYAGTYLLPPVTAYFMYQPEIHAIGTYQKITVK